MTLEKESEIGVIMMPKCDQCKGCYMDMQFSVCPYRTNIKYEDCPCFECLVKGVCQDVCDLYKEWNDKCTLLRRGKIKS